MFSISINCAKDVVSIMCPVSNVGFHMPSTAPNPNVSQINQLIELQFRGHFSQSGIMHNTLVVCFFRFLLENPRVCKLDHPKAFLDVDILEICWNNIRRMV